MVDPIEEEYCRLVDLEDASVKGEQFEEDVGV